MYGGKKLENDLNIHSLFTYKFCVKINVWNFF